jgi:hypothetical protein
MRVRQVTPLECPECSALWLFWPKEQSGMDHDSLNLRSSHSCNYCENANYYNLRLFGKNPTLLPEDESEGPRCTLPDELGKPDWWCSRKDEHDGPCALRKKTFMYKIDKFLDKIDELLRHPKY